MNKLSIRYTAGFDRSSIHTTNQEAHRLTRDKMTTGTQEEKLTHIAFDIPWTEKFNCMSTVTFK
jgi:hypothetical protein